MEMKQSTLYIVGTPIGNLGDFSPRAVETLQRVDFIAAEDTRVTLKLLNHFHIKKPLLSYFEHNQISRGQEIVRRLQNGENAALVSDAGMPAISDPGETLVAACRDAGIPVYVVPGPTAVISALAVSGLPTGRFTFEGFLSMNKKNRRLHLRSLSQETRTMVFYEAPHKLRRTLRDLCEALGDRPVAIVREITKIHEEVLHTTLCEAARRYRQVGSQVGSKVEPKGEFVLVIGGLPEAETAATMEMEDALEFAVDLAREGASASEAAKQAARESGLPKSEIYRGLQALLAAEGKDNPPEREEDTYA